MLIATLTKTTLATAALALSFHQLSAQTVIDSLPFVISASGNYMLGENLTFAPSQASLIAISVNASNVTIDLNGFGIARSQNTITSVNYGIFSNNRTNIRVKNGSIAGFSIGIDFDYLGGSNINNNHLVDGVRFTNEQLFGVLLHHATNCSVQNCVIYNTGYNNTGGVVSSQGTGIGVSVTGAGAGNALLNNQIARSTLEGISTGTIGGTYLDGNFVSKAPTGYRLAQDDKYRNNVTISCPTPFAPTGATNLGGNN